MTSIQETRPLAGMRVLVTRPRSRATSWVESFGAVGADVIPFPVFELVLPDADTCRVALGGLEEMAARGGAWVAFTSVPAVEHLLRILEDSGRAALLRERFRVACVGHATRVACEECGLAVTLEAPVATGADLARALLAVDPRPAVLHPTSMQGLADIEDAVRAAGGIVARVIVCVPQVASEADSSRLAELIAGGRIDLLTFASPSAVEGLMSLASGETVVRLRALPALAVGPTTEDALRRAGFQRTKRAASPRVPDVVRSAVEFLRPRR